MSLVCGKQLVFDFEDTREKKNSAYIPIDTVPTLSGEFHFEKMAIFFFLVLYTSYRAPTVALAHHTGEGHFLPSQVEPA